MRLLRKFCCAPGAGALIVIAGRALSEQQMISNMPSVNQTEHGRVFALQESLVRNSHDVSLRNTTNSVTYGVTRDSEVAMTVCNADTPRVVNTVPGIG